MRYCVFFIKKAIDNLDLLLAALGCLINIPLIYFTHTTFHNLQFTTVSIISSAGFITYFLLSLKKRASSSGLTPLNSQAYLCTNILFLLFFTGSILSLYLRPDIYVRPLSYFIFIMLMIVVVALQVLFLPKKQRAIYITLLYIIIIGLSLQWSQLFIFPTVVGIDPWYHQYFAHVILNLEHIPGPDEFAYSSIPLFHLLTDTMTLLTGLEYKCATALAIGLPYILCNLLTAFLLGKFIHSDKAGLLAALFLAFAGFHIRYGFWTIPNSMAIIFIPVITYLLFRINTTGRVKILGLVALFMIALMFTHPICTVFLGVILFLIWLGFKTYKKLKYSGAKYGRVFLYCGLIFTIAALGWWSFGSGYIHKVARIISSAPIVSTIIPERPNGMPEHLNSLPEQPNSMPALHEDSFADDIQTSSSYTVPVPEQIFTYSGRFLYLYLAIIGALYLINKKIINVYGFSLVFTCFILLFINLVAFACEYNIYVGRWLYFIQILLAVPTGISILWISGLTNKTAIKAASGCAAMFVVAFITVFSPQLNMDNRLFTPNMTVRYAFTSSEVQAAQTIDAIYDGTVGSDWYVHDLVFSPELSLEYKNISPQLCTGEYELDSMTMVWIRKEITVHPFRGTKGIHHLDYNPLKALKSQGYNHIYSNNTNNAFIRRNNSNTH